MLADSPDEAHASLQMVVREVTTELNEARAALEAFSEQSSDRGALHRFVTHLHMARGALRLAEVYGGALLGEEMEQVARYLDGHDRETKVDADALDALMRAMEQLPAYVERVASGGRDVPLALLPLLNDLRAVRGSALLSEGTLLLLNLRSDEPARPAGDAQAGPPVVELARRLRPRFQLALLGWIRGEHVVETLGALSDIAHQFEAAADHAAALPALVGGRCGDRGPAAGRHRRQRVGQAAARQRRSRAPAPAGAGRGALRGRLRRWSC